MKEDGTGCYNGTIVESRKDLIDTTHRTPSAGPSFRSSRTPVDTLSSDDRSQRSKNISKTRFLVQKYWNTLWNGPADPKDEHVTIHRRLPLLDVIDDIPSNFRRVFYRSKVRYGILFLYCLIWFFADFGILYPSFVSYPYLKEYGSNEKIKVVTLSCNSQYGWNGKNAACGVNAEECMPFDRDDVILRCPSFCDHDGLVYSAIAVGEENVKYTGYIIGGGANTDDSDELTFPYRLDSYPCASAAHAGIISPVHGGCVRMSTSGPQKGFPSRSGLHRSKRSIKFPSYFPGSFIFKELGGKGHGCRDPRVPFTLANIFFGYPVFYLYETSITYWIITIIGFWDVVLALDPPMQIDPYNRNSINELWSIGFQRLLPLCFILSVLWNVSIYKISDGPPTFKILLWYPLFWLGILNNVTFDRLPVDRLKWDELNAQAGAMATVICLISLIIICAIFQAYNIWKAGLLAKYVKIYGLIVLGIVVLGLLPGLHLRLHHYIIGILLIPGCATRSVSAYIFQGVLLGLVISGVGKWGFASIVETNYALSRGEAGFKPKPPTFIFEPQFPHQIKWQLTEANRNEQLSQLSDQQLVELDGVSLLVNDIETYVGTNTTINLDLVLSEDINFSSIINQEKIPSDKKDLTLYLRIARASKTKPHIRGDYTNAGVLDWVQGTWKEPRPGVT